MGIADSGIMAKNISGSMISDACERLVSWLALHNWESYDCFDGANSRLVRVLAGKNSLAVRLIIQLVKASPMNLRPILGIRKTISAKSVGLLASGYVGLYRVRRKSIYEDEARRALDWLRANSLPGYSGVCWGYPFDVYTRSTIYLAGTPTVVATSFIAQAFVDAYEVLGSPDYLSVARSACEYILKDITPITDGDSICIPYHVHSSVPVHNANLLGVALLSRVYRHTKETGLYDYAQKALRYTLDRQRPDGAWHYGEDPRLRWVDGFHTGFVLDALHCYVENTGDERPLPAMHRGLEYYRQNFFLKDGTPRFTDRRVFPVDVRCAAQAIQTFSLRAHGCRRNLDLACKVAHWTIEHLQDPTGYFYYQIRRFFVNRIPYIRWSQGPMLCALATLLGVVKEYSSGESHV
jgi:hypothetical protein